PYLLRDIAVVRPNQVWMTDITYLKMSGGFMYLTALIDVYSRYVVGWTLSNTLDTIACLDALTLALELGIPEIVNSDQGCQFTRHQGLEFLVANTIQISMTGKGRCLDNIYIESFWRSLQYEVFYLNAYEDIQALRNAISAYIEFYNNERFHQSLNYKTHVQLYRGEH
ncbi:MAG: IS3 family transposase, partial [Gammaproteobacteria bacterium]|nr:IS3 family transposase [Gammaproteobacteria bacterium]